MRADAKLNRRLFLSGSIVAALPLAALSVTFAENDLWHGPLSSDESEAGYSHWKNLVDNGYSFHIYLDGVEQSLTEFADSREGVVRRAKLDSDGNMYTLDDYSIARETLYGNVKIFLVKVT